MLAWGMKTLGLAAAIGLVAMPAADAHGPTRKKVIVKVTVNAPPDKVWAVMGNFQDVSWIAGVKSVTGTGGNATDSKNDDNEVAHRTITLDNGGTVVEGLYKYDAAEHTYAYRIDKVDPHVLPVNDYSSTISVDSPDGKTSTVEWRGAFYRGYMNNDPPPDMDDAASQAAVKGLYEASLAKLKKKVEGGAS